tara:strand:- start:83 stop:886 length:804 start_codon:yes stop_codon:yes gene_type:complete
VKNKVVIITGASSGIGEACALEFSKKGANLVLVARSEEKLKAVCDKINSNQSQAFYIVTDVSIESDCKKMIDFAIDKFGSIDILINNAGISMRALFTDVDLGVFEKLMKINFYGAVYCTKYALPYILKNKGSVIGISSIAGHKGLPGRTAYSASKFALQGFLEALRIENLKKDLHVLIVCPGFTASNIRKKALNAIGNIQSESPRKEQKMMTAEEVAKNVFSALKKRKNSIVLTKNGRLTVFLNKFFPKWVDSLVFKHMSREPGSPF